VIVILYLGNDSERPFFLVEEKGMEKAAQSITLNMLKMKTNISNIVAATGLPQSIVEPLKNKDNEI